MSSVYIHIVRAVRAGWLKPMSGLRADDLVLVNRSKAYMCKKVEAETP